MTRLTLTLLASAALALPAAAADFGAEVEAMLAAKTPELFGFDAPLAASAGKTEGAYRSPALTPEDSLALAPGLSATFLTREVADHADMMALFPAEAPTHLILCIEGDREEIAPGKLNPGVQSVALADGAVRTLLRGTHSCDGIRTTPWGTILFTEEADDGGAYEMFDPLALDNVVITDRASGATSDARVLRRHALPTMAWEGLTITPEGVVIAGDELRPGSDGLRDSDGGAIFKFIPKTLATPGTAITDPAASPLAEGATYAMQVSCYGDKPQWGQGCEIGKARWIEVQPRSARRDAAAAGATGYYRPEDLHADPSYKGDGLRFCWTNTGNEGADNFAEVLCATDTTPATLPEADAEGKLALTTTVNRWLEGDADANSFDNLAFRGTTGQLYVVEDHPNGDIWACLPDGADRDIKTDGCVRMLSVKDSSAEPTGFMFSDDGATAWVVIQHSDDANMAKVDDYGTDDLLQITGFRPLK